MHKKSPYHTNVFKIIAPSTDGALGPDSLRLKKLIYIELVQALLGCAFCKSAGSQWT